MSPRGDKNKPHNGGHSRIITKSYAATYWSLGASRMLRCFLIHEWLQPSLENAARGREQINCVQGHRGIQARIEDIAIDEQAFSSRFDVIPLLS